MILYKDKELTVPAQCPYKQSACINVFSYDAWKYDCLSRCETDCAWCAQYNNTYFCSVLNGFPPTVFLYPKEEE